MTTVLGGVSAATPEAEERATAGIDRFEERSSLRTWLFHILTNRAKSRGERERRTVTFTGHVAAEIRRDEPAVDPERFLPSGHKYAGHYACSCIAHVPVSARHSMSTSR